MGGSEVFSVIVVGVVIDEPIICCQPVVDIILDKELLFVGLVIFYKKTLTVNNKLILRIYTILPLCNPTPLGTKNNLKNY